MPDITNEQKYIILGIVTVIVIGCSVIVYQKYAVTTVSNTEILMNKTATAEADDLIYVHITGAVKREGVYRISSGDRIYELVRLAGGLASNANIDGVNFATVLTDGQKVNIPGSGQQQTAKPANSSRVVNINTADVAGLDSIPGIGKATAQKIIELRQKKGGFSDIIELKELSGFSDKKIAKLAPYITLN